MDALVPFRRHLAAIPRAVSEEESGAQGEALLELLGAHRVTRSMHACMHRA
jgi:hypothetical protein